MDIFIVLENRRGNHLFLGFLSVQFECRGSRGSGIQKSGITACKSIKESSSELCSTLFLKENFILEVWESFHQFHRFISTWRT